MGSRIEVLNSIANVKADDWNQLVVGHYPFLKWEFLSALESTGATSERSGWIPQHIICFSTINSVEKPVAALPCFKKLHSYGEYVFDWSWADAYHRHELEYYPKLLCAAPFTPASGPRLLGDPSFFDQLIESAITQCKKQGWSSFHVLLPNQEETPFIQARMIKRDSYQFHWQNENYACFDDFLATFTSRKRKNVKKERNKILQNGIKITWLTGDEITEDALDSFYTFYQATYLKRGMQGYFSKSTFKALIANMPDQIHLCMAYQAAPSTVDSEQAKTNDVAAFASSTGFAKGAALYFSDDTTLYGRYWGCLEEFDSLHFECCYYQGIEFAIANNLNRFDPGTQGEHKIARGFKATKLQSFHWIAIPEFHDAIDDFIIQERNHLLEAKQYWDGMLPFKNKND